MKVYRTENEENSAMERLAEKYIEMKSAAEIYRAHVLNRRHGARVKNDRKLAGELEKVAEMGREAAQIAAQLPEISGNDDYLLLHGVNAEIKGTRLKFEVVPVIFHNNGGGHATRAIELFSPDLELKYNPDLSWRDNVGRATEKHIESKEILRCFFPSRPEMAEGEDFVIRACADISEISQDRIKERLVTTEDVKIAAEKAIVKKIKDSAQTVERKEPSVRERIMAEKKSADKDICPER